MDGRRIHQPAIPLRTSIPFRILHWPVPHSGIDWATGRPGQGSSYAARREGEPSGRASSFCLRGCPVTLDSIPRLAPWRWPGPAAPRLALTPDLFFFAGGQGRHGSPAAGQQAQSPADLLT